MAGFENDVLVCKNMNFDQAAGRPHLGQINAAGKIPIGTGNTFPTPEILGGSLTSAGNTVTITYSSPNINLEVAGGAAVTSVATANATPQFVLAGSTETVDFNKANLALGSNMLAVTSGTANVAYGPGVLNLITSGNNNTGVGNLAAQSVTSGSSNVIMGFGAGRMVTTGSNNTFIGTSSGSSATTGLNNTGVGNGTLSQYTTGAASEGRNTAIGTQALNQVTSGTLNTALGSSAANALTTGTNNIIIGVLSGSSYTTSESSNILIGAAGTIAESNVIRIGTQGSGAGQQLQTYLAGVLNTVSGRVVKTTVPGAYPYTTLTTDYVILVDTSSARTINLIATPVTGTTYRIKDNVGSAAANNITITPAAGTIDGAASLVVNSNWGSVDLVYNSSAWRVL